MRMALCGSSCHSSVYTGSAMPWGGHRAGEGAGLNSLRVIAGRVGWGGVLGWPNTQEMARAILHSEERVQGGEGRERDDSILSEKREY